MSLRFQKLEPVPQETAKLVKEIYPKGHPYIEFADKFGEFLECWDFSELYSKYGQSSLHPARVAMAILLQHAEGLSDNQVSERIKDSLIWKYFLRLPLNARGWDDSVFSEFRDRLIECNSSNLIFDKLLESAREAGLLKHTKQRTDSTHVKSAAAFMNRVQLVFEAVRNCLEELLTVAPLFIHQIKRADWTERYFMMRPFNYKLPKKEQARIKLVEAVANDGFYLIEKLSEVGNEELLGLESVYLLTRVLSDHFDLEDAGPKFKKPENLKPSGERLHSVQDPEATLGAKRGTTWLGFKAHISETIDDGAPHLITNVTTTKAHENDSLVLHAIHKNLIGRDLKMEKHWVDSGYVQVDVLAKDSKRYGIEILTRISNGHSWQSLNKTGFDLSNFLIDWRRKIATCPAGVESSSWKKSGNEYQEIQVVFPKSACQLCPMKKDCTRASSRILHLKSKQTYDYMLWQRQKQETKEFIQEYKKRAGVEGTIAETVRETEMRRSRFVGQEKTHFHNVMSGAALNFLRIGRWLMDIPQSSTRISPWIQAFGACA